MVYRESKLFTSCLSIRTDTFKFIYFLSFNFLFFLIFFFFIFSKIIFFGESILTKSKVK